MSDRTEGRLHPASDVPQNQRIAAGSSYMCVSSAWKYVYSAPDDREFFFDRAGDPAETRNKVGVEFCADALSAHKSALLDHLRRGGETAGIEAGDWKSFPHRSVDADPDTGLRRHAGFPRAGAFYPACGFPHESSRPAGCPGPRVPSAVS